MSVPQNVSPSPNLPSPTREGRWQPLRSGLLNLYRYDYEEFHFSDGRLLLRGNNGSGKSRILALQLPFLLDGEVNPSRVEPDGDQAKRIEWNLLMGRHPDRTGYTWIEFGLRTADGLQRFFTLGCGMRAVAGHSGLHSRWFFVTSRRIGRDLFLQTSTRQPLGRDRLQEALGGEGRIFVKADEYRRAVDETLFGLGPRYGALIELLLRLRRPQLSRKLDEEELSGALSDALPILPATLIEDIAVAFSGLQADRDMLRDFTKAREAVATFLREYAVYVRIAVRRRATRVRQTHSAYETAQRAARLAEVRSTEAAAHLERLTSAQGSLETQLAGAESAERTLRESPQMRTADEVNQAGRTAQVAARALAEAQGDEQSAAAALAQARAREESAVQHTRQIEADLTAKLQLAESAAVAADLADLHREQLPSAPTSAWTQFAWVAKAESALRRALKQRENACALLRAHEHSLAEAKRSFSQAELAQRHAENEASAARESEHAARTKRDEQGRALLDAYGSWRAASKHLRVPHAETMGDAFATWLDRRNEASPLREAIESAHTAVLAALAAREAGLNRVLADQNAALGEIRLAIDRLEHGESVQPPPSATRRSDRSAFPGAPLWRVCDFRQDLADESRAGLEAALQASGLLDAWLLPDGTLLDPSEDTFLLGADMAGIGALPPARSLAHVLRPAIDADDARARLLSPETIERALAHIGLGADCGLHWVSTDGRWQLGPVQGRWTKTSAEYVGASTRDANRRRQLQSLHLRATELSVARQHTLDEHVLVVEDRAESRRELERAPLDEPVFRAGYELEAATRAVAETVRASEGATRETALRRDEHREMQSKRDGDASDLKLSLWLGRIDELVRASQSYDTRLAALWPTIQHWETVAHRLSEFRDLAGRAQLDHHGRRVRREAADAAAESARQRFETLQETHGAEISEILSKLATAESEVRRLKHSLSEAHREQLAQTQAKTRAEGDRIRADEQRADSETQRGVAIASLQTFSEQRLLAEADPRLRAIEPAGWTVSRAVEIAREIEPCLVDTPETDEAWLRRQDSIHGHIQDLRDQLITHGHQPETHQLEDLVLVRCVFQARPHTMTELGEAFTQELNERDRLLEAREREIIENHLLAEVAVELQKLIRAAEIWRVSANEELVRRPTSSGVRFRFQWEPDNETSFPQVRPILLRKGELWTPGERTALAAFLQDRIRAEQASDESGSWRDRLAKALDYRRWHRFVVERQQEGQWRRLDKRTYGTGSGGEKALALTLPRFAAAAAHYRSAAPTAPRLVMLDEAFAGIDPTMRAQCLGVLTQFDLDVMMTSELEWGCYATVPALAIYHLTTLPGIDAVAATRWLWNGRERQQRDGPLPVDAPPSAEVVTEAVADHEQLGL